MSQEQNGEESVFGSVYNWGTSLFNYAHEQLNTLLSAEDLEVVDPNGDAAHRGSSLVDPDDRRQKMWSVLAQYIGQDVMSLMSVPVWIMEPFTVLQKISEIMEYTELLDKADRATSPAERLACVTAFAVTPYGAVERAWKPFNPILGETFELACGDNVRFLAEQVSHHPPIAAAHGENAHFTYDIVSAPQTKFLGNSTDVYPYGRTHIKLKTSGEIFCIVPPTTRICNLVIGRTWIDNYGKMAVINCITGDRVDLDFTPCGWFGEGHYEFSGPMKVGAEEVAQIKGKWNDHCDVYYSRGDSPVRLWSCVAKPANDDYGRTYFCYKCNTCSGIPQPLLTDSRRRPDMTALDKSDTSAAGKWKTRLEEMQRAEKRERLARGDAWQPKWFTHNPAGVVYPEEYGADYVPLYEWNGAYERRPVAPVVESAETVWGVDFQPWQYPELHANGTRA